MLGSAGRAAVLAVAVLTAPAAGQIDPETIEIPPEIDPYTQFEADAMERAGYVAFNDFDWAQGHDTREIRRVLGGIPILFLETEHFRIGSTLGTYRRWTDSGEKERIEDELRQLRTVLPKVQPRTREIDPWLRLHLTAQRLENLHREFFDAIGVSSVDSLRLVRSKFTVLLCERASDFNFYTQQFFGRPSYTPERFRFGVGGTIFYGCAAEFMPGEAVDGWMHCSMAHGVAKNLIDSLCPTGAPLWLSEGVAAWFSRSVDPRWNFYSADAEQRVRSDTYWKWEPKVRARMTNDAAPGLTEILSWNDPEQLEPSQLMMAWSRVDHMFSMSGPKGSNPGGFERLLEFLAAPLPESGQSSTHLLMMERQFVGFHRAFGRGPAELDEAWRAYVRKNYER